MRGLEVKYYRKVEEPCCLVHLNYRELLQVNIIDARNVCQQNRKSQNTHDKLFKIMNF